jgi:hypothetical protein
LLLNQTENRPDRYDPWPQIDRDKHDGDNQTPFAASDGRSANSSHADAHVIAPLDELPLHQ